MSNPLWSDPQTRLRGEPVIEVTRGEMVESIHHLAACAVDDRGGVVYSLGSIDVPVFLRSSAKPFIAAAAIAAGVAERFGLETREVAVMAASHTGQAFHVEAVRSILEKIGLSESALQCGAHAPYNEAAAEDLRKSGAPVTAVYNNCSGKHAGILALCKAIGADSATYLDAGNPAQQRILQLCAGISDQRVEDVTLGVDGCGIPVYAIPLRNAAISFMRLATLSGVDGGVAEALRTVRDAMIAFPEYVSGTAEFDTRLMQAGAGALACKGGAEGVHGSAVVSHGVGLVTKVVDGASRARAPGVLAILRRLRLLDDDGLALLEDLERPRLYNRSGRMVGEIRVESAQAYA